MKSTAVGLLLRLRVDDTFLRPSAGALRVLNR